MTNQKCFCLTCKKDLSNRETLGGCECGSNDFIYGDTITLQDGVFKCSCGSDKFKKVSHFNMNPRYISTYQCYGCDALVSKETYYESPYYFY